MLQRPLFFLVLIAAASASLIAEEKPARTYYTTLYVRWKNEDSPKISYQGKIDLDKKYTKLFLELAKEHQKDDTWLACLTWTARYGIPGSDFDEMFDLLARNAPTIKNTLQLQLVMSDLIPVESTRLIPALKSISETHPDSEVRGAALYALAARTKRDAEEKGDDRGLATAAKLLQQVLEEYPDVSTHGGLNRDNATELLDDLRSPVAVLKEAPNSLGKTISEDEFDLSDVIKGKVAILSFSGHSRSACREMHYVQKQLISRFPRESFVQVEINNDRLDSPDDVRKEITSDGVDWIVVTDGTLGPISKQWRVTEWPTFILVDAQGRIRRRATGNVGKRLMTWVEELIAEEK